VEGFSGARHKGFRHCRDVEAWLAKNTSSISDSHMEPERRKRDSSDDFDPDLSRSSGSGNSSSNNISSSQSSDSSDRKNRDRKCEKKRQKQGKKKAKKKSHSSSKHTVAAMANSVIIPAHVATDPSTGQATEIYGATIEVEEEVLKILCSKGVSTRVRKELMEAAIDVVSLPGKSTSYDESQLLE
jgi:hypothetical protein